MIYQNIGSYLIIGSVFIETIKIQLLTSSDNPFRVYNSRRDKMSEENKDTKKGFFKSLGSKFKGKKKEEKK